MFAGNSRQTHRRVIALASLAVVVPLALEPGRAVAQSGWQGAWKQTVAAANKEGTLILGAPRPVGVRKAIVRLWKKDFPGIALNLSPAGGGEWQTRIKTERKAGKFLWDV